MTIPSPLLHPPDPAGLFSEGAEVIQLHNNNIIKGSLTVTNNTHCRDEKGITMGNAKHRSSTGGESGWNTEHCELYNVMRMFVSMTLCA